MNWLGSISESKINLRNFGVKREDIAEIVKLATIGESIENNPIVFDEEEIEDFWRLFIRI